MSLIADAATKLGCTEESLFWKAAEWEESTFPAGVKKRWMWEAYQHGSTPKLVEDFAIMVMAGRVRNVRPVQYPKSHHRST